MIGNGVRLQICFRECLPMMRSCLCAVRSFRFLDFVVIFGQRSVVGIYTYIFVNIYVIGELCELVSDAI